MLHASIYACNPLQFHSCIHINLYVFILSSRTEGTTLIMTIHGYDVLELITINILSIQEQLSTGINYHYQ